MKPIAYIETGFKDKFGIPRQSGLAKGMDGKIVFEKEYNIPDAFKGLEDFSHIWIIWGFSEIDKEWSPTVRPPKLGGNKRIGVFATRSPFRPNHIGLSSVKLDKIDYNDKDGVVLYVSGADMVSGTPIYDIKPYLPYVDCHSDAKGGFTEEVSLDKLSVVCDIEIRKNIPLDMMEDIMDILSVDPRPSYHNDPERVYGMFYKNYNIKFKVDNDILTICEIIENSREK